MFDDDRDAVSAHEIAHAEGSPEHDADWDANDRWDGVYWHESHSNKLMGSIGTIYSEFSTTFSRFKSVTVDDLHSSLVNLDFSGFHSLFFCCADWGVSFVVSSKPNYFVVG